MADSYRRYADEDLAEQKKITKYSELEAAYIVIPVTIETTGVVGTSTMFFLKELGGRIADVTEKDPLSSSGNA